MKPLTTKKTMLLPYSQRAQHNADQLAKKGPRSFFLMVTPLCVIEIRDGDQKAIATRVSIPYRPHDQLILTAPNGQFLHRKITHVQRFGGAQILSITAL